MASKKARQLYQSDSNHKFQKMILGLAFKREWVRVILEFDTLNIQAKNLKQVHKAALFLSKNYEFDELYYDTDTDEVVDFDSNFDLEPLKGDRLEFFLKRGKIPSKLVRENLNWAIGPNKDRAMYKPGSDYILIWVNIKDLFANTDKEQKLDVDDPSGGKNRIGDRVRMAKVYWSKGNYMDPPMIHYNDWNNEITFTDGRHRLVAAYQLGEKYAPVYTDKDSANKIRRLIETKTKVNEEIVNAPPEDIVKLIKRDCKPWLKQAGKNLVYRGTGNKEIFVKKQVRTDRYPLATPDAFHDYIDNKMKEKGFKARRKNSVFVTGDLSEAKRYGYGTYVIFPIGDFDFTWSPKIMDLYYEIPATVAGPDKVDDQYASIDQKIKKYINVNLIEAIKSNNEIMIRCDYYYAVQVGYFEDIVEPMLFGSKKEVNEVKILKKELPDIEKELKIYVNPSSYELSGIISNSNQGEVRYLIGESGKTYIWDSYYLNHTDMKEWLEENRIDKGIDGMSIIKDELIFYITWDFDWHKVEDNFERHKKVPSFAKMLKGLHVEVN